MAGVEVPTRDSSVAVLNDLQKPAVQAALAQQQIANALSVVQAAFAENDQTVVAAVQQMSMDIAEDLVGAGLGTAGNINSVKAIQLDNAGATIAAGINSANPAVIAARRNALSGDLPVTLSTVVASGDDDVDAALRQSQIDNAASVIAAGIASTAVAVTAPRQSALNADLATTAIKATIKDQQLANAPAAIAAGIASTDAAVIAARRSALSNDLGPTLSTVVVGDPTSKALVAALPPTVLIAEFFPGANDTQQWQNAINAAIAAGGGKITTAKKSLTFTNLEIAGGDNIELDFNGANLTVDPTTSGVNGAPFIYAHGTPGTPRTINATQVNDKTVIAPGYGSSFAAGDNITLSDSMVVPAWDGGTPTVTGPGGGIGYTGRLELNRVQSVAGDILTLERPIRFDYSVSPKVMKFTPLQNFKVRNIGKITEVDPGGPFVGDSAASATTPHLIAILYAENPVVSDVWANGYQLHIVQARYCIRPITERIRGINPFRPTIGGHGYVVRFHQCLSGTARSCFGNGVRHVVDDCQSTDTLSDGNTSWNVVVSAYSTHGLGCRRFTSSNDVAYGGLCGWHIGNASFAADYDAVISNPRGGGFSIGVNFSNISDGLTVVNPQFYGPALYGIVMSTGSKGLRVRGGRMFNVSATLNFVIARAKENDTDAYGIDPIDVEVDDLQQIVNYAPSVNFFGIQIDAGGIVKVTRTRTDANANFNRAIDVGAAGVAASDVIVEDNIIRGSGTAGFWRVFTAPTGRSYSVRRNKVTGAVARTSIVDPVARLYMADNDNLSSGAFTTAGANTITAALSGGAVIERNIPTYGPALGSFGNPLSIGSAFYWTNVTSGKLMYKSSRPTSDADGALVGS